MRPIIRIIRSATAASLFVAAPLVAQGNSSGNANLSNHQVAGIAVSAISGIFAPGFPAIGHMSPNSITELTSLSAGTFVSPVSGGRIPAGAGASIAALIATGSAATVSDVQNALNAAGGPTAEIAALMTQLAGLTNSDGRPGDVSKTQLIDAVKAYNALISSSSQQFIASMPPMLLAIQGALLTVAVNRSATDR